MKADPGQQWKLLDLAALDTRVEQVRYRRSHLPEADAAAQAAAEHEAATTELVRARTARSDVERELAKAEADVQVVRDRIKRTTARFDDGSLAPREMQNLQGELESLERRHAVLEGEQTVIRERLTALAAKVEHLSTSEPALAQAATDARAAEGTARECLDEAEQTIARSRSDLIGGINAELVALYETIRSQTGMGAAALTHRRCGGCNLELLGEDLRRVAEAAENEVVRCDNCARILVRTGESGL